MRLLIFITFCTFLIAGCNSNNNGQTIELNDGQKWEVNAEMKPYIQQGNKILTDFITNKSTDYKQLAKRLKNQNDKLIKSCTMQGESHDELHKWLHPHMKLIDALLNTENPEQGAEIVSQIEKSFNKYQTFFE